MKVGDKVKVIGTNHITIIIGKSKNGVYELKNMPRNQYGCNCYFKGELIKVK